MNINGTEATEGPPLTLGVIQKAMDAIKAIRIPDERVFVCGVDVYYKIYKGVLDSIDKTIFTIATPVQLTKTGFKYANSYFVESIHADSHTFVEILDASAKKAIINDINGIQDIKGFVLPMIKERKESEK